MSVDTFTKEQFEAALPKNKTTHEPMWEAIGLNAGEWTYVIPVAETNKRICIRSSVKTNGVSANTGKNSIRLWVEYFYPKAGKWFALGKYDAHTTREPGWEERMHKKLQALYGMALEDSKGRGTSAKKAPAVVELEPATAPTESGGAFNFLDDKVTVDPVETDEEIAPTHGERIPNLQQAQAINAPVQGALRMQAPPGSGKTFVLTHRVKFLVAKGVDPAGIAAVTLTRVMAEELHDRILRVNPGFDEDVLQAMTTIHALCLRMLKADGDKRQVPKFWEVKKELEAIAERAWVDDLSTCPGWKEIAAYIDSAKAAGLTSERDMEMFQSVTDKWGNRVGRKLHRARADFDRWMQRNGFISFADMLFDVEMNLLNDVAFRERWQAHYTHILVDEGQDTGGQAMRILTTLAAPQGNFAIVGDDDQLLFRFAGAAAEKNMRGGFEERYPDAMTVAFATNYRSTEAIINASMDLIAYNYAAAGGPYENKYRKVIIPADGAAKGTAPTFTMYADANEEATAVAKDIKAYIDAGGNAEDIFIATRTRAQTGYVEGHLTSLGIPYINLCGQSFFGLCHVNDVISYIRLAHDESDSKAFQRVYNIASSNMRYPWGQHRGKYCSHRYLGKEFLSLCKDRNTRVPQLRWASRAVEERKQKSGRDSYRAGVNDLTVFVSKLRKVLETESLPAAIEFVVNECYRDYLMSDQGIDVDEVQGDSKLDDLKTVAELASRFTDIGEFLTYVQKAQEAAKSAKKRKWDGHTVVGTTHRLKGTERDIVFGMGWCEGIDKFGQPVGLLPHTFSMRPPVIQGALPIGSQGRVEDERCLGYVQITRAKLEVHLSGCAVYRKNEMQPSRFIKEMGLEIREPA